MKEIKKDVPARERGISRRDFTRGAAIATAAIAAMPSEFLPAQASVRVSAPRVDEPNLSPESRAEAEGKIQAILRKYGDRLSDEQKTDIRRLVMEGQKPLEALRAYRIENSDQPGTVFKLYPDFSQGVQYRTRPAKAARRRDKE